MNNVSNMSDMFFCCKSLKNISFPDIDKNQMIQVNNIFYNCHCLENMILIQNNFFEEIKYSEEFNAYSASFKGKNEINFSNNIIYL